MLFARLARTHHAGVEAMRPDTSDWQNDRSYEFLDTLSTEGLAWECLRRRHPYQDQYANLVRARTETLPLPREQQRRWGLRFPRETGTFRYAATGNMVAIERSGRRRPVAAAQLPARRPKALPRPVHGGA